MEVDDKTYTSWIHHLRDEADAAFLYRRLAGQETDPKRQRLFLKLADVEDRHVGVWEKVIREHGGAVPSLQPSVKARLMAALASRMGSSFLLNALLREEGQEVKGYLALHHRSKRGSAKDAALLLARESAHHAQTLQEMAGQEHEAWHSMASGGMLRNIVYGFNDGLTANFGLVAGVLGADFHVSHIVLSGVAGTIADALSMASSGYLAAKSEREVYEHEFAMEREEIRMMPELETEELALIYEAKGMDAEQAQTLAEDVMRNPEQALSEMVKEELGIGADYSSPMKEAVMTGVATAFGAIIPVAPFLFLETRAAAWTSFIISMAAHFGVGAARSLFTGRGIFRSGLDMFVVGLGVAIVAYLVGEGLMRLMPGM